MIEFKVECSKCSEVLFEASSAEVTLHEGHKVTLYVEPHTCKGAKQ